MLPVSQAVKDIISQGLAVVSTPRVIVEWNQNRYTPIDTVDNAGSPEKDNAYDLDLFPISSIVEPVRPTAGILLGKTGEGVVTDSYSDQPGTYRTYTVDKDAKYKYWTSQQPNSGNPFVTYKSLAWTNKLYLCFETAWAYPTTYTVQVTTDGTNWSTVASNIHPDANGVVALYRQSDGTWSQTVTRDYPTQLKGIRVNVSGMSKSAHLNVIEMGLRLESDLTPYLIDYSVTNDLGQSDFISPMGQISSNTGALNLSNIDGRFNDEAPAGADSTPWYRGLIDRNAKVTIDLGINTGSTTEYIRQATMFVDTWGSNDAQSVVQLKDASMYLQDAYPASLLMQNVTIGQAIWRVLDSVGFNSYAYSKAANESPSVIAWFWTDVQKTVWETISTICRSTQTAVYFDPYGVLQIKTRESAFDKSQPVQWTVDDQKNGTKQPDLIELGTSVNYEANHVKVNYNPTDLATDDQGRPISEVLWQPDGDVMLRSSALKQDMTATDMYFVIDKAVAAYWQFSGMVNIRGELIKYDGKEYAYRNTSGQWVTEVIHSADDQRNIDNNKSDQYSAWRNYYTGKMIVTERGVDWTTPTYHDSTIKQWLAAGPRWGDTAGNPNRVWTGGFVHIPEKSMVRMQTNAQTDISTFYCAPRGKPSDAPPVYYGTRFKFPSNPRGSEQTAGIFINSDNGIASMYCIEIMSSDMIDGKNRRGDNNEVRVMKRAGGHFTSLSGKGQPVVIAQDMWHDLDIYAYNGTISVNIDGIRVLSITDNSLAPTGVNGLYTRGYTIVDFEYYYSAGNDWPDYDPDNSNYLDLIRGGYYSDQFYNDGYYRTRNWQRRVGNKTTTYKQRYSQRSFDEFGMQVHEVREFDVTFDKFPVQYSDLYVSNTSQTVVPEYVGNSFTAHFLLANASHTDCMVNGTDVITYGADSTVDQKLMITGRTIQKKDQKTYEVKDDQAIKARSEIVLEFTSDWLQSEAAAKSLGDWIVDNWSEPADECDITIFGNPLLEVGDLIAVNYANQNMTAATHKYFVLKVAQSWSSGLETQISVRRARI